MNTFADAIQEQMTFTANGMPARETTANACVDFFFKAGAMRRDNIIPLFVAAYVENPNIALRITAWLRDVREGAGERQSFRDILRYLDANHPDLAKCFIPHVPIIGRWDDLLVFSGDANCKQEAFDFIADALRNKDALAAKWMPREKSAHSAEAKELASFMKMSLRDYRKMLSSLTNVTENDMCKREWGNINYSHVPSVAHSKYRQAFIRNDYDRYQEYVSALTSGDTSVKINASAIYPHDVIKRILPNLYSAIEDIDLTERNSIKAQWDALPNYVGSSNVLPMVDVSGSMYCPAGNYDFPTCMHIAVSLGLYMADKNTGKFADSFLTFSGVSKLVTLKGDIVEKLEQMIDSEWGMNTNLENALQVILQTAINGSVPNSEMPEMLLILSDMNFDRCVSHSDTAIDMMKRKFNDAGYTMPAVAFWNISSQSHVPVRFNENGVVLISGYSPSILDAVLASDFSNLTPEKIMLDTVMKPKYNICSDRT